MVGVVGLGFAVACGTFFSPLPPQAVLAAAEPLCALGHPMAQFVRGEIVGSSSGGCGGGTHDRYVDLDVFYDRRGEEGRMRVRIYLHEVDPCRITTQVLEDTGPPPLLLDNGVASQAVGEELCRRLAEVDG
jgi:hypothetical protein